MLQKIVKIEGYVRDVLENEIAHDFKHVDRVRNWGLRVARGEGYDDLELIEAAALLHDVGLSVCGESRADHAALGADVAHVYLTEHQLYPPKEIDAIVDAVRNLNTLHSVDVLLINIIRDADMLDLWGAVGIMRAFTSKAHKPEYDPTNIKGKTWRMTAPDVDRRFAEGIGIGPYIMDQINFQISCYDNLNTATARELGAPLVDMMRQFVLQLEYEVRASRN